MADEPSCPHCRVTRLFHTGALWMCPGCGLMITKHALAADTAGAGREILRSEDRTGADGLGGSVTD